MGIVYFEDRTSLTTQAKMADMALALAQARHFVKDRAEYPGLTDGFQEYAQQVLTRIDAALDGTIHSFTPNSEGTR